MTHAELVDRILKYRGPSEETSCIDQDQIENVHPISGKHIFKFQDFLKEFNNKHTTIYNSSLNTHYSFLVIVSLYKTYSDFFQKSLLTNLQRLCGKISNKVKNVLNDFTKKGLDVHPFKRFISVCSELDFTDDIMLPQFNRRQEGIQNSSDDSYDPFEPSTPAHTRTPSPELPCPPTCSDPWPCTRRSQSFGQNTSMSIEEKLLLRAWINDGKIRTIIPSLVTHKELAKAVEERLNSIIGT
mgnify:CR=1 FL=1